MKMRPFLLILLLTIISFSTSCKPKKTQVSNSGKEDDKVINEVKRVPSIYSDGCVSCSLQVEKEVLKGTTIKVIFQNNTNFVIPIEKRHLFFGSKGKQPSLENSMFEIFLNGEDITFDVYKGETIKRKASMYPQDFHFLPKHGSYEATIDLDKFYNLTRKGKYSIKYCVFNCIDFDLDQPCCFSIESNTIKLTKEE